MTTQEVDIYLRAGRIAAEARELGAAMIRPGARLEEVQLAVEELIRSRGGEAAFPAQISMDHVAAHDCCPPGDPRTFAPGSMAKLDLGVHVDGWIADTAVTVDLRDGAGSPLVAASREALEAAIALARPGVPLAEIGAAVAAAIEKRGFRPVRNLTGHGLGRFRIHAPPQVPSFRDGAGPVLAAGTAVAIEPFACDGEGWVHDLGAPEVFQLRRRVRERDMLPLKVERGLSALNGLPFARRDLARLLGPDESAEALRRLKIKGLLLEYAPLAERPGVRVSQAEHTLLLLADRVLVTTDPGREPLRF